MLVEVTERLACHLRIKADVRRLTELSQRVGPLGRSEEVDSCLGIVRVWKKTKLVTRLRGCDQVTTKFLLISCAKGVAWLDQLNAHEFGSIAQSAPLVLPAVELASVFAIVF